MLPLGQGPVYLRRQALISSQTSSSHGKLQALHRRQAAAKAKEEEQVKSSWPVMLLARAQNADKFSPQPGVAQVENMGGEAKGGALEGLVGGSEVPGN